MSKTKSRMCLTLEKDIASLIVYIAIKQKKTVSAVLEELVSEALETREDIAFSKLADSRDKGTEEWISHEEFWSQVK